MYYIITNSTKPEVIAAAQTEYPLQSKEPEINPIQIFVNFTRITRRACDINNDKNRTIE